MTVPFGAGRRKRLSGDATPSSPIDKAAATNGPATGAASSFRQRNMRAHNDESAMVSPARHKQEAHRRVAELSPCRYQLSEPVPCNRTGDSHLQRGSVTAGLKQRSSQRAVKVRIVSVSVALEPEIVSSCVGASLPAEVFLRSCHGFRLWHQQSPLPSTTQRQRDRPAAVRSDVTQTVGEVAFTCRRSRQMRWAGIAGQSTMIDIRVRRNSSLSSKRLAAAELLPTSKLRSQMKRLILPAAFHPEVCPVIANIRC